jgi:hypothetical protein
MTNAGIHIGKYIRKEVNVIARVLHLLCQNTERSF